jgi:hypothetical protein
LGIYWLIDSNTDVKWNFVYLRIALYIIFVIFFAYSFTKKFLENYYSNALLFLALGVVTKCVLDWLVEEFGISLTSALVSVVTTFNFNLGVIQSACLNVVNSVNFLIRIIFIYYESGYSTEVESDRDLIFFYSIASFVILLVFISLISFYVIHKSDLSKRNAFLT